MNYISRGFCVSSRTSLKLLLHTWTKSHVVYVAPTEILSISRSYTCFTVQKAIAVLRISNFS